MLAGIPLLVALLVGCGRGGSTSGAQPSRASGETAARDPASSDWFVDRAQAAGLDFAYFNGMAGDFYFPETIGGGVGLLDYDNDGDLDVYFAQEQILGRGEAIGQAAAGWNCGGIPSGRSRSLARPQARRSA